MSSSQEANVFFSIRYRTAAKSKPAMCLLLQQTLKIPLRWALTPAKLSTVWAGPTPHPRSTLQGVAVEKVPLDPAPGKDALTITFKIKRAKTILDTEFKLFSLEFPGSIKQQYFTLLYRLFDLEIKYMSYMKRTTHALSIWRYVKHSLHISIKSMIPSIIV